MNVALTDAPAEPRWAKVPPKAWQPGSGPLPVSAPPGSVARTRPPWWLWPHLLSLDAPLVALVWQRWWARGAGVALPVSREIILGLGVWLIYLVDRLADTTGGRRECGATRHAFSARHRSFLLPLAAAIALTMVVTVWCALPATEFRAGLGLLTLALVYFWLTHGWPGRGWAAYVPKEAMVGAMFSGGSVFFVACRSHHLAGVSSFGIVLFAGICLLNCALITRWERHTEDVCERSSLLNAFPWFSAHLGLICVLLAGLTLATPSVTLVPVAASALLLAALDHYKNRMSIEALRVLADVVLLTPGLLFWA